MSLFPLHYRNRIGRALRLARGENVSETAILFLGIAVFLDMFV